MVEYIKSTTQKRIIEGHVAGINNAWRDLLHASSPPEGDKVQTTTRNREFPRVNLATSGEHVQGSKMRDAAPARDNASPSYLGLRVLSGIIGSRNDIP